MIVYRTHTIEFKIFLGRFASLLVNALRAEEFGKIPENQSVLFRSTALLCRCYREKVIPAWAVYVCLLASILFFLLASSSLYGKCAGKASDFYWQTPEVWFQWRRSHWWSFLKIKSWKSRAIDQHINENQLKFSFHEVDEIQRGYLVCLSVYLKIETCQNWQAKEQDSLIELLTHCM